MTRHLAGSEKLTLLIVVTLSMISNLHHITSVFSWYTHARLRTPPLYLELTDRILILYPNRPQLQQTDLCASMKLVMSLT